MNTDAIRMGGLETLDIRKDSLSGLLIQFLLIEKIQKRCIRMTWFHHFQNILQIVLEVVTAAKLTLERTPIVAIDFMNWQAALRDEIEYLRRLSMNEFSTQFHGQAVICLVTRPDTAANAIAGFHHSHLQA